MSNTSTKTIRTHTTQRRHTVSLLTVGLAAAVLLTACGGGSDEPCGGSSTLRLDVTYEVNGQLVDPAPPVLLARGQPVQAVPRAVGLPAACAGDARWTFRASSEVPPGLNFDTTTGVISGTPSSRATFRVELRLGVVGYTADVVRTVDFFM